ncbi:MAG: extracellular solute-binding protein, partial [Chloroflexota bacterium]
MNNLNPILQFLVVTSLKTTCILVLTVVGLWLLRHSSASLRHWLLNISLMAILSLPLFTWLMPAWSLPILPQSELTNVPTVSPTKPLDIIRKNKRDSVEAIIPSHTSPADAKKASVITKAEIPKVSTLIPQTPIQKTPSSASFDLQVWLFVLWCAGVYLSLTRALWQIFAVKRISQRSMTADSEWIALLDNERKFLNLKRPVRLQFSEHVQIPMTWGLWKPIILLPVEACGWDMERRRVVLLHELAHIVRWDYLSQWGTVVCCALNWFNPLVWKAARQAEVEREKSCDDLVLSAGIRGTDYARHLLDIAYTTVSQKAFLVMGLAMARRSGLELRIRGILNAGQRRNTHTRLRVLVLITLLVLLIPLSGMHLERAAAQTDSITLSVAMPDPNNMDALLKDFEAQHPGVHVVALDAERIPDAADGLAAHLAGMETAANAADVLFIEGYNMSLTPFDTRAGYVLDLSPLINGDAQFQTDDFYPQLWSSFQWDNGIWGIPFAADPVILTYNKKAFDKANIAYPTGDWTMTDWANAATELTQKDADGNVIASGFANSGRIFRESIWRTFFDSDAVDANVFPNAPQFDRDDIKNAMETYHALESQGAISSDTNSAAMFVDAARRRPQDNYGWSLLPGNHMVMLPYGLAISAGTEHPDLAYELVKYLSAQPDLMGGIPARKSLNPPEGIASFV